MLDTETKRRIDTCRDILVGKVPDPKSQVEQITIALIYKFMSDMDAESVELGGKRKFFSGDYKKYDWSQLVAPNMGGHETLNLYGEAITQMSQNTGLPELFRDIFKNAYLPYRDPETLRAFLKEINTFTYDHSERLGDAFEYLLSVLGAQGDAGQFRTPRHIIDFMVAIIDPKKDESILDPACGTAGFLISSYKHIRAANTKNKPGDQLTADDKMRLVKNIRGYDISPDMVRLSLVNLYLHGFTEPHIDEYDTLTSEEKWNEQADIILANPPFMSPKGGIKPHKRFSVQAKRAEVLFVDYIAEHLSPTGRAAVIVPEGIIFQSGNAYKQLRKNLVETAGLVAVVSLPAGVFQPYSGVKTSILILDRRLAKQRDDILFVKIENDGFGLGAQRREVAGEQLTEARQVLKDWMGRANSPSEPPADNGNGSLGEFALPFHVVSREKLSENGEYNLSGERYKTVEAINSDYPMVELGEVCEILNGYAFKSKNYVDSGVRVIRITNVQKGVIVDNNPKFYPLDANGEIEKFLLHGDDLLLSLTGNVGRVGVLPENLLPAGLNQRVACLRPTKSIDNKFLFYLLNQDGFEGACIRSAKGIAQKNLSTVWLSKYKIPLPPLSVQEELVAEIGGYQKIIDGARAVLDHYRPHIPINPDWPMAELKNVVKLSSGRGLTQAQMKDGPYCVYGGNGQNGTHSEYFVENPNIVIGRVGAYCGAVHLTNPKAWITDNALYVTEYKQEVDRTYLAQSLTQLNLNQFAKVGGQPSISQTTVYERIIPLPPLAEQQAIVSEIEVEQGLVDGNRELITRFEKKIQQTIARVWGRGKAYE